MSHHITLLLLRQQIRGWVVKACADYADAGGGPKSGKTYWRDTSTLACFEGLAYWLAGHEKTKNSKPLPEVVNIFTLKYLESKLGQIFFFENLWKGEIYLFSLKNHVWLLSNCINILFYPPKKSILCSYQAKTIFWALREAIFTHFWIKGIESSENTRLAAQGALANHRQLNLRQIYDHAKFAVTGFQFSRKGLERVHSLVLGRLEQRWLETVWLGHSTPPNLGALLSERVPPALTGVWKGCIPQLLGAPNIFL